MKPFLEKLKNRGLLNKSLERAFLKINREDFLPKKVKRSAKENKPLLIGNGQTNSQPSVVAFMLSKLDLKEGDKVLDIGFGSGWTTALLAELVGKKGDVFAIERIDELYQFGRKNVNKYGFLDEGRVEMVCGDGYKGFPGEDSFDKILVSASLDNKPIPKVWEEQLKEEGSIVTPIKDSIYKYSKKGGKLIEEEFFGFRFVPLVKENE